MNPAAISSARRAGAGSSSSLRQARISGTITSPPAPASAAANRTIAVCSCPGRVAPCSSTHPGRGPLPDTGRYRLALKFPASSPSVTPSMAIPGPGTPEAVRIQPLA